MAGPDSSTGNKQEKLNVPEQTVWLTTYRGTHAELGRGTHVNPIS